MTNKDVKTILNLLEVKGLKPNHETVDITNTEHEGYNNSSYSYLGKANIEGKDVTVYYAIDGDVPECFWVEVYVEGRSLLSVEIDKDLGLELYCMEFDKYKHIMAFDHIQSIMSYVFKEVDGQVYKLSEYVDDKIVKDTIEYITNRVIDKIKK